MKKLLIFHPVVVAPYRLDFFNAVPKAYNMKPYMFLKNMISQKIQTTRYVNNCPSSHKFQISSILSLSYVSGKEL